MYLALIILPLLGSIVSDFFSRKKGVSGAQLVRLALIWTTVILFYINAGLLYSLFKPVVVTIVGILLLLGAMAKSSQNGLHVWLPLTVEGVTLVGALIHTASMITVGVFLLICSASLECSDTVILLGLWIGAFTTRFIYLTWLYILDYFTMYIHLFANGNFSIIAAILLNIINLTLFLYCNNFFMCFLDFYYFKYDLMYDYGTLNCESNPPPSHENQPHISEDSNHNKGKKMPKPNLHIEIGPKTDSEKDTQKIGNCVHEKLSNFKLYEEKEVEDTHCDFPQELDNKGKPVLHKAFESITDNAFVCDNCQAVFCKDCVEDYSSSDNSSPNN